MSDLSAQTQISIYTRLSNDGPLAALGFGVYDEPPSGGQADKYVNIGEHTMVRGGVGTTESHTHDAWELTELLHVWTRGFSTLACKQGMGAIIAALESTPIAIAGWGTGTARVEMQESRMSRQGDETWRHGVLRFRVVVGKALTT